MQAKKFKVHRLKRNEIGQGQCERAGKKLGWEVPFRPFLHPKPAAATWTCHHRPPDPRNLHYPPHLWKDESKLNAIKLNAAQRLADDGAGTPRWAEEVVSDAEAK